MVEVEFWAVIIVERSAPVLVLKRNESDSVFGWGAMFLCLWICFQLVVRAIVFICKLAMYVHMNHPWCNF